MRKRSHTITQQSSGRRLRGFSAPPQMQEFLTLYPSGTDAEAKASAEQLLGDIRQKAETWRWLTLESQTGKAGVYGYQFSYQSPYSPVPSHVAEIPFVFGNFVPQFFNVNGPPADAQDHALGNALMSYWVNFAKSGNPNGDRSSAVAGFPNAAFPAADSAGWSSGSGSTFFATARQVQVPRLVPCFSLNGRGMNLVLDIRGIYEALSTQKKFSNWPK